MNALSGLRRQLPRLLLALVTTCLAAGAASAQIDPVKQQFTYTGAVGVSRGQIARLNVVYHDLLPPGPCTPETTCFPPGPCAPDATCLPPGPCAPGVSCAAPDSFRATLTFYFADGSVSVQRSVTLTPDRGAALVFAPASFERDGRATARASVAIERDPSGYMPRVVPTVEVMDSATGQTSVIDPGSIVGFNPQPEPPGDFHFGLFNVVKGQTARVHVSYVDVENPNGFPPGPCRVTVSFYDGDGRLIGQQTQALEFGATAQFDYSTTDLPAGARQRIRASVRVESSDGELIPCIMPALEVFAADTGRSALHYAGALIETR
jgi:hypothetical protein